MCFLACSYLWQVSVDAPTGEDYFETISLLYAVSAATQRFVLVEAGSSNGYWSLKAAKAFRQKHPEEGSCDLILIDSEYPMAQTAEHLRENSIHDLCNISLYQEPATASLLDRLVQAFGSINMIHVDIQSAELDLLKGSEHLSKVQALHVGTHSRDLHHNVREELLARGFSMDFDYSPFSFEVQIVQTVCLVSTLEMGRWYINDPRWRA